MYISNETILNQTFSIDTPWSDLTLICSLDGGISRLTGSLRASFYVAALKQPLLTVLTVSVYLCKYW
jgi:hypothetical protein